MVFTGHNTAEGQEEKEEWEKIKYMKISWGTDWGK